ncbi:hypothetical protein D1007_17717 [Hordeum vulgare]|nr:hypothetical protein D1007_17717 [Hordeum vulgare]
MFIKEFLGHHITPLQAHSCPHAWEFTGMRNPMRLHVNGLTHDELDGALGALLGSNHRDLPRAQPLLYACDHMKELVSNLPVFDKWGFVGSHRGSSIIVLSSVEDGSDQDSEATEGDEDAGRMPP